MSKMAVQDLRCRRSLLVGEIEESARCNVLASPSLPLLFRPSGDTRATAAIMATACVAVPRRGARGCKAAESSFFVYSAPALQSMGSGSDVVGHLTHCCRGPPSLAGRCNESGRESSTES